MKKYIVKQYESSYFEQWNAFIGKAKNATFLFHRDFMEYHEERFQDYSLLIFEGAALIAVLPANRVGNTVYSHQGLTYGGLVYSSKINGEKVASSIDSLLSFLKQNGIQFFYFKPIPSFYPTGGNKEIDFFLLKKGAFLERKEMNMAINLAMPLTISKSKLKHFRKIEELDLEIVEEQQLESFWQLVLEPRLFEKYDAKPVHTLEEMTKLKEIFPATIKQFSVYDNNAIIAGITLFEMDSVVKSQYGATTKKGEELRALDFLFINLIKNTKRR
ncbi:FemAB family protein [Flavobacterium sp. ACAM 123]|uniref:FemAB family protein n=1 Tax=Flavobacterium sp. ACAM 123 TaxID=1189620 RepID=UPI00031270FA|nr:FemAB family protein [Flavobacterium sp. ACAM 123]